MLWYSQVPVLVVDIPQIQFYHFRGALATSCLFWHHQVTRKAVPRRQQRRRHGRRCEGAGPEGCPERRRPGHGQEEEEARCG
jgi:hypothetical protein